MGSSSLSGLRDRLDAAPLLMEGQAAEFGNPPWEEAALRILILRLSSFSDVCRSTPHLFLFQACRAARAAAFIDFSFFPSAADRELLNKEGLPLSYGIASGKGMAEYDLVLVSNAYALELLNLPFILERSGIKALRSRRDADTATSPLVILGGSNASASACLLEDPVTGRGDSIVDAIFFGEGEEEAASILGSIRPRGASGRGYDSSEKRRMLEEAAESAPGLFYPGMDGRVRQARAFSRDAPPLPAYPLLNSPEAASYKLNLSSGCPSFCTFCMESWDRKPYREASLPRLMEEARNAKRKLGASAVELASFNFNAHSRMVALMQGLSRLFFKQNAMSQRADILQGTQGLLSFETASGKRSYTVGVEGISERMRRYYAKELDASTLEALLSRLLASGVREIKLFYIISGLEAGEDLSEFASFAKALGAERSRQSPGTRIVFSSGYLARMPGTPLAFAPLELEEAPYRRVAAALEAACAADGFEFRMPAYFDEYALGQVLALGGKGLLPLLLEMADRGFCFDANLSRGAWDFARARLRASGFLSPSFLGEKPADYPFSLGFLDFASTPGFRYARYLASKSALSGAPEAGSRALSCLSAECLACGACLAHADVKDAILSHAIQAPARRDVEEAQAILKLKAKADIVNAYVEVPLEWYGAEPAFLSAAFLRRILEAAPDQTDNLLECEECLFCAKGTRSRFPSFSGPAILRLRAYDAALLEKALGGLPWLTLREGPAAAQFDLAGGRARIRLEGGQEAASALEKALSNYLKQEVVPHTFRRGEAREALWDLPRAGLKKKILSAAKALREEDGAPALALEIESKFDFHSFLAVFRRESPDSPLPRICFLSIREEGTRPC